MNGLPDPIQTLFATLLAIAVVAAAAPQMLLEWLRHVAERQRAATLRQQAIQEDLLRMLAARDGSGPEI